MSPSVAESLFNTVVCTLLAWLGTILKRAANLTWRDAWKAIFQYMVQAEKQWTDKDQGAQRKEWVIQEATKWFDGHVKVSFWEHWFVQLAFEEIINNLIVSLNDKLGHNWLNAAVNFEMMLNGELGWIDPLPQPAADGTLPEENIG
jgi:hypothetical protein